VTLPVLDGSGRRSLADLRGKVVVLNFWASWCGPCESEAPVLERAQRKLAGSGGTVLGVTYKDDADASRDFVKKYKLSYPSLRDDRLDLAPKYGTTKLPETFVLDKAGHVVAMSRGEVSQDFLSHAIDQAQAVCCAASWSRCSRCWRWRPRRRSARSRARRSTTSRTRSCATRATCR
jgi:cytochrome c biogenesis protein CcmG/thiol:disulfide interchange protein DsbE